MGSTIAGGIARWLSPLLALFETKLCQARSALSLLALLPYLELIRLCFESFWPHAIFPHFCTSKAAWVWSIFAVQFWASWCLDWIFSCFCWLSCRRKSVRLVHRRSLTDPIGFSKHSFSIVISVGSKNSSKMKLLELCLQVSWYYFLQLVAFTKKIIISKLFIFSQRCLTQAANMN